MTVSSHEERWLAAVELVESGDAAGALFQFQRLASEGVDEALAEVAHLYEHDGQGIEADIDKAIEWYHRSVKATDDVNAHIGIGRLRIAYGTSDAHYQEARRHLERAVALSDRMGAHHGLGTIYEFGYGTEKDIAKARRHYEIAAQKGHLMAAACLARTNLRSSFFKSLKALFSASRAMVPIRNQKQEDERIGIY